MTTKGSAHRANDSNELLTGHFETMAKFVMCTAQYLYTSANFPLDPCTDEQKTRISVKDEVFLVVYDVQ